MFLYCLWRWETQANTHIRMRECWKHCFLAAASTSATKNLSDLRLCFDAAISLILWFLHPLLEANGNSFVVKHYILIIQEQKIFPQTWALMTLDSTQRKLSTVIFSVSNESCWQWGLEAGMSNPQRIKPKLSAWLETVCFVFLCFFVIRVQWPFFFSNHTVSLCNPVQWQVIHSSSGSPSMSCGVLDIGIIRPCRLWRRANQPCFADPSLQQ